MAATVMELVRARNVMYWDEIKFRAGNVRTEMLGVSHHIQVPQLPLAPVRLTGIVIHLDGLERYVAVAKIHYILNQKLKLRGVNNRYNLHYTRTGHNSDPCEVLFVWKGVQHRMASNYNGNTPQVGNHRTESFVHGMWRAIRFDGCRDCNDPCIDFLLMCEIARRRTVDPQRGQQDVYFDLPMAICVPIGILLWRSKLISIDSFLCSGGTYNIFQGQGTHRSEAAERLIIFALNYYTFGELCFAVDYYFQFNTRIDIGDIV
jgi:hypothetical protein